MESQNLKKFFYDEKSPEVTDATAREEFCGKWYDKIKAEYDQSKDAKAKAAETVAMRKLDTPPPEAARKTKGRGTKKETGRGRRVQSPKKEILTLSPHNHKSKSNDVPYLCYCVTNFSYRKKKYQ